MKKIRSREFIVGVILTLIINICFAVGVNAISWAGRKGIAPFAISIIRNWSGIILFSLYSFLFLGNKQKKIIKKDYKWIVLAGFMGLVINGVAATYGYTFTLVIHASLILSMAPIWIILGSAFFYKEKLNSRIIIGVLLSALATIFIIFSKENSNNLNIAKNIPIGDVLVLLSTLGYAGYILISKKMATHQYHPIQLLKYVFISSTFFITPICLSSFLHTDWHLLTITQWITFITIISVVHTFLPYLLISYAVPAVGGLVYGLLVFLQPLFASLISILFLGERLTNTIIYGTIILFFGLFITQTESSKNMEK